MRLVFGFYVEGLYFELWSLVVSGVVDNIIVDVNCGIIRNNCEWKLGREKFLSVI